MKIECSAEKLKTALSLAERITGKNSSLPVLASVLVVADGSHVTFRATNLSLGVEVSIPAKITSPGIMAVRGDVLNTILSTMAPSLDVTLEADKDNLAVKTKRNKILLKSNPHEDFPTLPGVDGIPFSIASQRLVEGLKAVYYSASVSDIKQEISSVYIYGDGDELVFVATDSFRLAEKRVPVRKIGEFEGVLIPFKNIGEIIRVLSVTDGDVDIVSSKNQISFSAKGIYLTSRLIDATFPDYRQILPKEFKTEAVVLAVDLGQALKLSNVFSDQFNQLTLSLAPKKKSFEIYAKHTDIGENRTELDAALAGEDVEVNINHKYLMDCFQSITSDSVSMSFNEATRPLVVRGIGDTSFLYLIMPMNR